MTDECFSFSDEQWKRIEAALGDVSNAFCLTFLDGSFFDIDGPCTIFEGMPEVDLKNFSPREYRRLRTTTEDFRGFIELRAAVAYSGIRNPLSEYYRYRAKLDDKISKAAKRLLELIDGEKSSLEHLLSLNEEEMNSAARYATVLKLNEQLKLLYQNGRASATAARGRLKRGRPTDWWRNNFWSELCELWQHVLQRPLTTSFQTDDPTCRGSLSEFLVAAAAPVAPKPTHDAAVAFILKFREKAAPDRLLL